MTFTTAFLLAATMTVLAAIPGVGVATVGARSLAYGFKHGLLASLGVVAGDLVFIGVALFGLALLTEALGEYAPLIRYVAAIYLVAAGVALLKSRPVKSAATVSKNPSSFASFMAGLLITLGNQKAVLFYLGLLPAFIDPGLATLTDAAVIASIAALTVGGVMLAYAYAAVKARSFLGSGAAHKVTLFAGVLLIGTGAVLIGF